MTECGNKVNTYLLKNKVIDEVDLFIASQIIGGKNNLKTFSAEINLQDFELKNIENLAGDVLFKFLNLSILG
jgi:riboflavin biosynthesis pyrimidine reductase